MEDIIDGLVKHLVSVYHSNLDSTRYLVGLSGAPGSGKTTLAHQVVPQIRPGVAETGGGSNASDGLIPIWKILIGEDGFHYYRAELNTFPDAVEAHARRGAPHTFNAEKFVVLVKLLKRRPNEELRAPSFCHRVKDPVEEDIVIKPTHRIVMLEGNYVHLTVPPWDEATRLLDERWFIDVEREVARGRVIQRHLMAGIAKDEEQAARRFDENDWVNAIFLMDNSDVGTAHKRIPSIQDSRLNETAQECQKSKGGLDHEITKL